MFNQFLGNIFDGNSKFLNRFNGFRWLRLPWLQNDKDDVYARSEEANIWFKQFPCWKKQNVLFSL